MVPNSGAPQYLRMDKHDNVVVIANDGGLKAGTCFPDGLTLLEDIPQAHKVASRDIAKGEKVIRYGVVIGIAIDRIPKGRWVQEKMLSIPSAPELDSLLSFKIKQFPPLETSKAIHLKGIETQMAQ